MKPRNGVEVIEGIKWELLEAKRKSFPLWRMGKTFLDRLLPQLYVERGQFVLEFLQNAEDARMELGRRGGFFRIELDRDTVVIEHDGKPFDEGDLRSLCQATSSKKPSKGYKGYIGVGWKSVFKVSSRVEVYSGELSFAFDREYWREDGLEELERLGISPDDVLWQVTPIPIRPAEYVDNTRFVVRLDNPSYYDEIVRSVEELRGSLFLFLDYINRVKIRDHVRGRSRTIEWFVRSEEKFDGVGVREVTVNSYEGGPSRAEKFLVFEKEFDVPAEVKSDKATIDARREDVVRREVAIAFALDPEYGDLQPLEAGQFWGVYSFLPLHEVRSGLPFLIQADFIVHPGRRSLNLGAKWNRWLMECVAEIVEVAVEYLSRKFPESYLRVFEFREIGDEVYEKLIRPTVIEVIEQKLEDPEVLCIEGHTIKLSSAVKAGGEVLELVRRGIITEEDLKHIYGTERHILDPKVALRSKDRVEELDLARILDRRLIEARRRDGLDAVLKLLTEVYRLAYERRAILHEKPVVTSSGEVKQVSEVFLCELPSEVEDLKSKFPEVDEYLRALDFVHERMVEALGVEVLKWLGVREVDLREICEKKLLPKIYVDQPQPTEDVLLTVSAIAKKSGALPKRRIWVVTTEGGIRRSDEVYYPAEVVKNIHDYVDVFERLDINFLDMEKYERYDADWREFFKEAGVKGTDLCRFDTYFKRWHVHFDYVDLIYRVKKLLEESRDRSENVKYVRVLKNLYEALRWCWEERKVPVKALADDGSFVDSDQCFMHDDYGPKEKWAKWRDEGFDMGPFVTREYVSHADDVQTWREFLTKVLGVKEEVSGSEPVEDFAVWFAERRLRSKGYEVVRPKTEGYDLLAKRGDETVYVEVKGRRRLGDVKLTEKESELARRYRDRYWLVVVADIPNDPKAYLIRDPVSLLPEITISGKVVEDKGELI